MQVNIPIKIYKANSQILSLIILISIEIHIPLKILNLKVNFSLMEILIQLNFMEIIILIENHNFNGNS